MWISQLLDNCLDGYPSYIEVILYEKSVKGFDILDNGVGWTQNDLSVIAKCLGARQSNDLYKKKSIGWRGEALSSLVKCCNVTMTTKHKDECSGLRVTFTDHGDIQSLEPVPFDKTGTLIEVRDVHRNNWMYEK